MDEQILKSKIREVRAMAPTQFAQKLEELSNQLLQKNGLGNLPDIEKEWGLYFAAANDMQLLEMAKVYIRMRKERHNAHEVADLLRGLWRQRENNASQLGIIVPSNMDIENIDFTEISQLILKHHRTKEKISLEVEGWLNKDREEKGYNRRDFYKRK